MVFRYLPVLAAGCAVLAFLPPVWLWRRRTRDPLCRLLDALLAAGATALPLLVAPWAFASLALQPVAVILLAAAVTRQVLRRSFDPQERVTPPTATLLAAVVLIVADLWALSGHLFLSEPVSLRLPLGNGAYTVIQGGANSATRLFHARGPERYALDIVRLNAYGNRAAGLVPAALEHYASFGAPVVCPCDGVVETATDGLPDAAPGMPDRAHPHGNHVVLRCGGVRVVLTHLRQGTVAAKAGSRVAAGAAIGQIGNSGNSAEPHLHISAVRLETVAGTTREIPVPMSFNGRTPTLNSRIGN